MEEEAKGQSHNIRSMEYLPVPVLRLDVVGEGLGFLVRGVVAVMLVSMGVLIRSNILELDDITTLAAALDRTITRYRQPDSVVRVSGVSSATGVLLVTSALDNDGVVKGSLSGGVEGSHVEDVNALHLSDKFQTLKTGGLLNVRGDGTGLSTGSNEVIFSLDFFKRKNLALLLHLIFLLAADDGRGKWTSSNGSNRGAPCKGESCALEEHCPRQLMVSRLDEGREKGWWRGSLEV